MSNPLIKDEAITYGDYNSSSVVKEEINGDKNFKLCGWIYTSQSKNREKRYKIQLRKSIDKNQSPSDKDKSVNMRDEKN